MTKSDDLADFERRFREGLETRRAADLAAVEELRETQVLARAFLANEAHRLKARLGPAHPRVRTLREALQANLDRVRDLGQELEIRRIQVPRVAEEEALVHGRVVGQDRRGIAGLTVCLVGSRRRELPGVGPATTDSSGYYAVVIPGASPGQEGGAAGIARGRAGVYLGVFTADGTSVHRGKAPLELSPGVRRVENVVLRRRPDLPPLDELRRAADRATKPPAQPGPPGRAKPPRPPAETAEAVLARMAGQGRAFEEVKASVAKLARWLAASKVKTAKDLAGLAEAEDREVRDKLRLPNLKSARAFKELAAKTLAADEPGAGRTSKPTERRESE